MYYFGKLTVFSGWSCTFSTYSWTFSISSWKSGYT